MVILRNTVQYYIVRNPSYQYSLPNDSRTYSTICTIHHCILYTYVYSDGP
jgi:hypothetical protein